MKGKYANAAERRRYIEQLEQRTAAAERERDRIAAELAALRATHEQAAEALRGRLSAAREQRDQNTAPRLAAAEERISELAAKAEDAGRDREELKKRYHKLFNAACAWLQKDTGCTAIEAVELLVVIVSGDGGTIVDANAGADRSMLGKSTRQIHTLQQVRGARSGAAVEQRLEERFALARDGAETAGE